MFPESKCFQLRFGPESARMRSNGTTYRAGVWVEFAVWHDGVYPAVGATETACIVAPNHHRAKAFNASNLGLVPIAYGNQALDITYRTSVKCHGNYGMLPEDSATAPQ